MRKVLLAELHSHGVFTCVQGWAHVAGTGSVSSSFFSRRSLVSCESSLRMWPRVCCVRRRHFYHYHSTPHDRALIASREAFTRKLNFTSIWQSQTHNTQPCSELCSIFSTSERRKRRKNGDVFEFFLEIFTLCIIACVKPILGAFDSTDRSPPTRSTQQFLLFQSVLQKEMPQATTKNFFFFWIKINVLTWKFINRCEMRKLWVFYVP